jgi:hypothetical protein
VSINPASTAAFCGAMLAATAALAQTNLPSGPPFPDGTLFIEAEDYNYNGGQFISDATDGMAGPYNGWAYQNLAGVPGIDFNQITPAGTDDPSGYRPADYVNGVGIEGGAPGSPFSDPVRSSFSVTNDSALGYIGVGGNWYNYTRVFPDGVYAPSMRISSGNAMNIELDKVVSDATQSNQLKAAIGYVLHASTGGYFSNYVTVPFQDAFGTNIVMRLSGQTTMRISPLNYANINYMAFAPVAGVATPPYVATVSPGPGQQAPNGHPPINILVADAGTGINPSGIQLWLNGANVTTGAMLTPTNNGGLNISYDYGSSLVPFSTYTLQLIMGDTNSVPAMRTNTWQFVARPVYTTDTVFIESEDYNYGSGQFISDASDGMSGPYNGWAYFQLTGTPEVDFHTTLGTKTDDPSYYRTNDWANGVGIEDGWTNATPLMHDRSRGYFSVAQDSGLSYVNSGQWYNYTRVFSDRVYSVYLEAASPYSLNAELDQVTGDPTLPYQSTTRLGNFPSPHTSTFYNPVIKPLVDYFGAPVPLRLSGTNTLRCFFPSTGNNYGLLNYMAFVPVAGAAGAAPYVTSLTPAPGAKVAGMIAVQIADAGSGLNTNVLRLRLNGADVTSAVYLLPTAIGMNQGGLTLEYNCDASLVPNSTNTIQLVVGDNSTPPVLRTNSWTFIAPLVTSFPANTLFVEAEDYNYNAGQYISDATDGMSGSYSGWAYSGLAGVPEVDFHMVAYAGTGDASGYRQNDFVNGVGVQGGASGSMLFDLKRSTFSVTADSMVGYNNTGKWYNYTRVFPAATYAVYARMASGSASPFMSLELDRVTSDPAQPNQTTNLIGFFSRSATSSFYDFVTVPLTNTAGGGVFLQLSGPNTFRLAIAHQYLCVNYLAFVPVVPPQPRISLAGSQAIVSWTNSVGWYKLQSRGSLNTGSWADIPNSIYSPVAVALTSTNQFFRLVPAQ